MLARWMDTRSVNYVYLKLESGLIVDNLIVTNLMNKKINRSRNQYKIYLKRTVNNCGYHN